MRKQYHVRSSARGPLVWDVDRLVERASDLPVRDVPLARIQELDEPYWFGEEGDVPTVRTVAEHARLILETELHYPIILSSDGRVMDGMHRVAKAYLEGRKVIRAVRFKVDPEPDYVGVDLDDLPYDEEDVL